MNMYGVIALMIAVIVLGHFFELGPAINQFVTRLADIPPFSSKGNNPALFELAVRMAYLITIVGIITVLVRRHNDD